MKIKNEMKELIKNRAKKLYPPKERASEFVAFIQGAGDVIDLLHKRINYDMKEMSKAIDEIYGRN